MDGYHAYLVAARAEASRVINDHVSAYLRFRTNQLVPVYRLQIPDDIFSMIFKLAVPADWQAPLEAPLTIAAVCRLWRQIAINTPRLWTRINSRSVHGFLPRAKSAPLDIEYELCAMDRQRHSLQKFLNPLISRSDQWRVLKIAMRRTDTPVFNDLANIPASNLERLSVEPVGQYGYYGDHFQQNIGFDLFSGYTPRLRELELHSLGLPLASPIFCGLTRLRLSRIRFTESDEYLAHQLLHIATMCPKLEELRLNRVYSTIRTNEGARSPSTPHVPLPLLRIFSLSEDHPSRITRTFLGSIQFPSTVRIELITDAVALLQFFPLIPNVRLINSLRIEWSNWRIRGWDCDGHGLLILRPLRSGETVPMAVFNLIHQRYLMSNATRLSIQIPHIEDYIECLITTISHLPLLAHIWLTFDTRDVRGATSAMSILSNTLARSTLRHLYLVDCPVDPGVLLEFVWSVFHRNNGQRPKHDLMALTLVNCVNIDDSTISELESLVPLVVHITRQAKPCTLEEGEYLPSGYHFPGGQDGDGVE
ncbi:hypothetical protein BOTBODRAFT_172096 [Botryobasidium botryosum FD-172 SS1]|uniref:F-box domain-containing protein n=1 Tax=Botryobasidium botryosum (strain FD-172 SS1) TaxID=930990 RepID=A0A067N0F7_BOTB1|nr:hypothetical protein BOTBODRAFT_172096 [Botryobasidium botryosum FD-172 SS1]